MAQTKIPLAVGMKLRIIKGDAPDTKDPNWHLGINWIAGQVPIGAVGTICQTTPNSLVPDYKAWFIDFPDHPIPADKLARNFRRGLGGQNVGDQFEVVEGVIDAK